MRSPKIGDIVIFTPPNEPGGTIGVRPKFDDCPAIVVKVRGALVVDLVCFGVSNVDGGHDATVHYTSVEMGDATTYSWRYE